MMRSYLIYLILRNPSLSLLLCFVQGLSIGQLTVDISLIVVIDAAAAFLVVVIVVIIIDTIKGVIVVISAMRSLQRFLLLLLFHRQHALIDCAHSSLAGCANGCVTKKGLRKRHYEMSCNRHCEKGADMQQALQHALQKRLALTCSGKR